MESACTPTRCTEGSNPSLSATRRIIFSDRENYLLVAGHGATIARLEQRRVALSKVPIGKSTESKGIMIDDAPRGFRGLLMAGHN